MCDPLNLSSFRICVNSVEHNLVHDELSNIVEKMTITGQQLLAELEGAKKEANGIDEFTPEKVLYLTSSPLPNSILNCPPKKRRPMEEVTTLRARCEKLEGALASLQKENARLSRLQNQAFACHERSNEPVIDTSKLRRAKEKDHALELFVWEENEASDTEKQMNIVCKALKDRINSLEKQNNDYLDRINQQEKQLDAYLKISTSNDSYKQRVEDLHDLVLMKETEIEILREELSKVNQKLADQNKKAKLVLSQDICQRKQILQLCEKYEKLKKHAKRLQSEGIRSQKHLDKLPPKFKQMNTRMVQTCHRERGSDMRLRQDSSAPLQQANVHRQCSGAFHNPWRDLLKSLDSEVCDAKRFSSSSDFQDSKISASPKSVSAVTKSSYHRTASDSSPVKPIQFETKERMPSAYREEHLQYTKGVKSSSFSSPYEPCILRKMADQRFHKNEKGLKHPVSYTNSGIRKMPHKTYDGKKPPCTHPKGILKKPKCNQSGISNSISSQDFSVRQRHPCVINEKRNVDHTDFANVKRGNFPAEIESVDILDVVSQRNDQKSTSIEASMSSNVELGKQHVNTQQKIVEDITQSDDIKNDDSTSTESTSSVSSTSEHIGRYEFLQDLHSSLKKAKFSHRIQSPKNLSLNDKSSCSEFGLSARQQEYAERLVKKYVQNSMKQTE